MFTPDDFLDMVLGAFYQKMHNYEPNNYDPANDINKKGGKSGEFVFDVSLHSSYLKFFFANYTRLYQVYMLLADETSKRIFQDLILYRLLGHEHIRLHTNTEYHWQTREQAQRLSTEPSALGIQRKWLGSMRHYKLFYNNQDVFFDGWWDNIAWTFMFEMYHYRRDGVLICPDEGAYVIDGGAFIGDTALWLAASVGPRGKVYSFEVLDKHCEIFQHNIHQNPSMADRIVLFKYALGEVTTRDLAESEYHADKLDPGFSLLRMKDSGIPIASIDDLVQRQIIDRVDFIKLDIEGYELLALKGAEKSIRRFKPKLAISLYHKPVDMFEIPLYIASINPNYKLYLEHYTIFARETVLYASE
jgi:FkbM family methyltransferase